MKINNKNDIYSSFCVLLLLDKNSFTHIHKGYFPIIVVLVPVKKIKNMVIYNNLTVWFHYNKTEHGTIRMYHKNALEFDLGTLPKLCPISAIK